MKLLKKYTNSQNNITYHLYQLNSGVKLVFLKNPSTIDFDISLILKAGSIYETAENVPKGTAHMLEHILFRPNASFPSMDTIYNFELGTKDYPPIYVNGTTNFKYLTISGHTNFHGTERLIKRLNSIAIFDKNWLKKEFNIEKHIVIAEKSRAVSTKKSKLYQHLKFLLPQDQTNFTYQVIGELKDIKRITIDEVEKYFNSRFSRNNLAISIQAKDLDPKVIQFLEDLTQKYPTKKSQIAPKEDIINSLEYKGFTDERLTGTSIYFSYWIENYVGLDYKQVAIDSLVTKVIRKVGDENLRDKEGIIYGMGVGASDTISNTHFLFEAELTVENNKISNALKSFDKLIFEELEQFILSSKGGEWLEHILSNLIYPHTTQYDSELAESSTRLLIENNDLYNANEYRKILKKITKDDILKRINYLQKLPPHIWIESNKLPKQVESVIKESNFWQRFK